MTMEIPGRIVAVLLLMLLLLLLLLLFILLVACKPWRFFSYSLSRTIKVHDLERPLVSDAAVVTQNQINELPRDYDLEGALQTDGHFRSPSLHGLIHKQRLPAASPHLCQGDRLVPDVVADPLDDISVGQTLKRSYFTSQIPEVRKHAKPSIGSDQPHESASQVISHGRSYLTLEVTSGPSRGVRYSIHSADTSRLQLTLGRAPPSDIQLKDSEVSGKHASIKWNLNNMKWELVDLGSLNGTLLNSQPISNPDSGIRQLSDPVELASGDVITLGTSSTVYVQITSEIESHIPFGVGMASDPMALRRGGKKFAMEDVCYYQWPLPGVDQFGLFGICDGHSGVGAAKSASEILPEKVATILSDPLKRERVVSLCDASDVLREAFSQTEACMNHYYEGCTATLLLVWADNDDNYFVQCANVGDSACVMNVHGKLIRMTEDHRITSYSERLRIEQAGEPLKDGETRLCGLNLARMLGDKFLKQQDHRFSSEPYISEVVHVDQGSKAFAVMASDGFWDVIGVKKAIQLVLQARERYSTGAEKSAEKIANFLLGEARTLRTKDNTSIIFLDFDVPHRIICKVEP
ncbi:protein phosphatase 2C 70-like isoform X1 [Cucurbita pepo subsp. pepo]|uniref:protein phosphatase 2C 70-like isoform X1 n=1 Tax=Cucurbita pepo subsp. pepo TaxID=3664 RepID=UPI000C9D9E2C|nr:protein phosphatase 2C 70-like isoform X1 [Cucurbita pepo subsp. pepo]